MAIPPIHINRVRFDQKEEIVVAGHMMDGSWRIRSEIVDRRDENNPIAMFCIQVLDELKHIDQVALILIEIV
ncbi:hypothetical protein QR98_0032280 [Sarcoptes scabiei]|uniref:Uncharacterized protein n=1 Tax=Sarcoptes scabiei TaxID=52283 RepID=A0A132A1G2_SARSC|nr:hypothetical protein QR98_0032280 [Sarcoptes scabiei]